MDGPFWREVKAVLATAWSVDELKMAQAVVLPLERGLTLRQTAAALGLSPGWVCRLRRRFERIVRGEETSKPKRGGRRRELLTPEPEAAFLAPYAEQAKAGGLLVVPPIQVALESYLGPAGGAPPSIGCCTGRAGASWHPTSAIRKRTRWLRKPGKNSLRCSLT